MITGLVDSGAIPVLERVVQFTSARHGVIADNVANLSTPNYKPRDLSPRTFQASLREAIDQRRATANPLGGELEIRNTDELRFTPSGINTSPAPTHEGVLFHDRNNRDLERVMQDLAENTLAHNLSIEMLRNQFQMLTTAISERV